MRFFIQIWRDRSAYPKTKRNRELDRPICDHVWGGMKEAVALAKEYKRRLDGPDSIMPFVRADIYDHAEWTADPFKAKPIRTIT